MADNNQNRLDRVRQLNERAKKVGGLRNRLQVLEETIDLLLDLTEILISRLEESSQDGSPSD